MRRSGRAGGADRIPERRYWRLETRHEPIQPVPHFLLRMLLYAGVSLGVILGWVLVGVLGYHEWGGLAWIDALLNASMIASGMGPVDVLATGGAKVFASAYAIVSGVIFISMVGLVLSPIVHRFLKRFHLQEGDDTEGGSV